jgi:hypothetical protein
MPVSMITKHRFPPIQPSVFTLQSVHVVNMLCVKNGKNNHVRRIFFSASALVPWVPVIFLSNSPSCHVSANSLFWADQRFHTASILVVQTCGVRYLVAMFPLGFCPYISHPHWWFGCILCNF